MRPQSLLRVGEALLQGEMRSTSAGRSAPPNQYETNFCALALGGRLQARHLGTCVRRKEKGTCTRVHVYRQTDGRTDVAWQPYGCRVVVLCFYGCCGLLFFPQLSPFCPPLRRRLPLLAFPFHLIN